MGFIDELLKESSDNISNIKKILDDIKRTSKWLFISFCSTILGFLIIAGCFFYGFLPVIISLLTAPLSPLPSPTPIEGPLQNILLIGMLIAMGPLMIVFLFSFAGGFFHSHSPRKIQNVPQFAERNKPERSSSTSSQIIHITGNNPKVNVNSVDKSTNIIGNVDLTKFIQIEAALDQIPDPDKRRECKNSLQELKDSVGTESYVSNYERFISTASDHMTLILPFIQFLSGFLKS